MNKCCFSCKWAAYIFIGANGFIKCNYFHKTFPTDHICYEWEWNQGV